MITRPHVCLRCQLQLRLAKSAPSFSHLASSRPSPRPAPHKTGSFYSTAAPAPAKLAPDRYGGSKHQFRPRVIKRLAGNRIVVEDGRRAPMIGVDDNYVFPPPAQPLQERLDRRKPLSERMQRTLFGSNGQQQYIERERLEGSLLGTPAEVILMKESIISYTEGSTVIPEAEEVPSLDISAELQNEIGLVGEEEVFHNLDQLRPKDGKEPVHLEDFGRLLQEVQSGFTVSQLTACLERYKTQKETRKLGLVEPVPTEHATFLSISPWMPETSASTDYLDEESNRGYSFASYTTKQRLALRVMREGWNLAVPTLEEGIGEVEMALRPADYDLLMKGQYSVMNIISSKYITEPDERIDGFRSRCTLRITTSRAKSSLIAGEVEQTLQKIKRLKVDLYGLLTSTRGIRKTDQVKWLASHFDDATLAELSLITRTDIQRGNAQTKLIISCIDDTPTSSRLVASNRAEAARRFLLTSGNFSNRNIYWLGCKSTPNEAKGAFVPVPVTEAFNWRERLRKWTRWTAPISKHVESQIPVKAIEDNPSSVAPREDVNSASEVSSEREKLAMPEKTVRHSTPSLTWKGYRWESKYTTSSSCILGSILHSHPPGQPAPSLTSLLAAAHDTPFRSNQTFLTSIPNVSRILSGQATQGSKLTISGAQPKKSFLVRLLPNPFSLPSLERVVPRGLSGYPSIEMHFSVEPETKRVRLQKIEAVVSQMNSDIMLPEHKVDIRFQQETRSKLSKRQGSYPPSIAEFLRNLKLPGMGAKSQIPPRLVIPIASHLCSGIGKVTNPYQLVNVEYMYAGLESRHTMTLDYDGWLCHYTSIEAGRAGGQRGELKLQPIRTNSEESIDQRHTEQDFVKAAFGIADSMDSGAVARNFPTDVNAFKYVKSSKGNAKFFSKYVDVFSHFPDEIEEFDEADDIGRIAENL